METIIGLLFVLLPVIFKLIGKRLEQSGQTEKAGKIKEIAQVFGDGETPIYDWLNEPEPAAEEELPQPVLKPVAEPAPVVEVRKPRRKQMLEEEKVVKKEKIDPKKLVVYSEIMKPKYTEKY